MKFKIFDDSMTGRVRITIRAAMVLMSFLSPAAMGSQSISLTWSASSDPSAVGYVLYGGSSSSNYKTRIDVGTNTTITVAGLTEGRTNYFVVTAYDSTKNESPASGQITYIVPGLLTMSRGATNGAAPQLSFPVAAGHWYEVQACTNLQSWATIWQTTNSTTNGLVVYQDPQKTTLKSKFYRLVMH